MFIYHVYISVTLILPITTKVVPPNNFDPGQTPRYSASNPDRAVLHSGNIFTKCQEHRTQFNNQAD